MTKAERKADEKRKEEEDFIEAKRELMTPKINKLQGIVTLALILHSLPEGKLR